MEHQENISRWKQWLLPNETTRCLDKIPKKIASDQTKLPNQTKVEYYRNYEPFSWSLKKLFIRTTSPTIPPTPNTNNPQTNFAFTFNISYSPANSTSDLPKIHNQTDKQNNIILTMIQIMICCLVTLSCHKTSTQNHTQEAILPSTYSVCWTYRYYWAYIILFLHKITFVILFLCIIMFIVIFPCRVMFVVLFTCYIMYIYIKGYQYYCLFFFCDWMNSSPLNTSETASDR